MRGDDPMETRTLRASDSEWEQIKEFDRILKNEPERAIRMMQTK